MLDCLQHPEVKLTLKALKGCGNVEWDEIGPPTNIIVKVDANADIEIRSVIHEILHVLLYSPCFGGRVDATLEEVFILGIEEYMWQYVHASPERERTWRVLIRKRAEEGLKDVPLKQLADRSADDRREKQ